MNNVYFRVVQSIFHECVQQIEKIPFLTREDKIHIFKQLRIILLIFLRESYLSTRIQLN